MSTAPSPPAPTDTSVGRAATTSLDVLAARRLARHLAAGATRWLAVPDEEPAVAASLATALDGAAGDPGRTVAVAGADGTDRLRRGVMPEDVVVVVATEAVARALCLRLTAWGPTTVVLPVGTTRPEAGRADLVLPPLTDRAAATERLTQIGRLLAAQDVRPGPAAADDRGEVCITCADEAIVAEVAEVTDVVTAVARTPDGPIAIDTTLVGPLDRHDLVLVHARTAIAVLDPATHTGRRGLDEA